MVYSPSTIYPWLQSLPQLFRTTFPDNGQSDINGEWNSFIDTNLFTHNTYVETHLLIQIYSHTQYICVTWNVPATSTVSAFWRQAPFCVVTRFTFCFTCSLLPLLLQTTPDMNIPSVDSVFCLVIITLLLCFVLLFSIFFPFLFLFHAPYCCFLSCPFFLISFLSLIYIS